MRKTGTKNRTYHWMVTTDEGNSLYHTCRDVQKALGLTRDRVYYLAKKQHKHNKYKCYKTKQALNTFRIFRVNIAVGHSRLTRSVNRDVEVHPVSL